MIKISSLVHKYTIWQDENIKREKTALDGISLDFPLWSIFGNIRAEWVGKINVSKALECIITSE